MGLLDDVRANPELAKRNVELVNVYRNAFMWDKSDGVGPTQKAMFRDIEQFCGIRQAKFEGSEAEMIKQCGRMEVLGRINHFLDLDVSGILQALEIVTKEREANE